MQKIRETELKLAGLKTKNRAAETRQKIIVGAAIIKRALENADHAKYLERILTEYVTRDVDKKEIANLREQLRKVSNNHD